jgi:c-di-GMP-binding flagellar brake protein YcgR
LFWKKSNKGDESSKILLSTPDEWRNSFRVTPSLNTPLKATLNKVPISILNISSGGFRFKKIPLEAEKFYLAEIELPLEKHKISALVELLGDNEEKYYRCRFLDLAQEVEDRLHRYVLNRQKEEQELNNRFPS